MLLNTTLKTRRERVVNRITPRNIGIFLILFVQSVLLSQNTIGTVLNTTSANNGYTLITPNSNALPSITYLIDNCGNVVNSWSSPFKGQGADMILEDGSLYRGAFDDQSTLDYGGNNGRLEYFDWDGNLIWGLTYSDTDYSFHHDYSVLPNGNLLLLVAQRMTEEEAVQAGRNPENLLQQDLYTEKIIEIEPVGSDSFTIVWEWDVWNHLVQDFDPNVDNFGIVAEEPGKFDINFLGYSNGNGDWLHLNSIDYNPELDQILISARFTSEIYIIDHSTTTEEAATDSGGTSGKGGSLLYRWGNPQAYQRGSAEDQVFYGQHAAHWIDDGVTTEGQIMVFNNGFTRGYSTVERISQPQTDENGNYPIDEAQAFNPSESVIMYQADPLTDFFAPFLSSAYTLENGNILINNGPVGELTEVDPDSNDIVWKYISPVTITNGTLSQGDPPGGILSRFFRASRYPTNYIGFENRDLTPGAPIELNPIDENCSLFLSTPQNSRLDYKIYPNPVSSTLFIETNDSNITYSIHNIQGQTVAQGNSTEIDMSTLSAGLYLIEIRTGNASLIKKIIKN